MIEQDLLDWKTGYRNTEGNMKVQFVTLKQQIGQFPVGTKFDRADFVYQYSENDTSYYLHLINFSNGKPLYFGTYKLGYVIKEVVDEPQ